jgi:YfiH family protein
MAPREFIRSAVLEGAGIAHGFGQRESPAEPVSVATAHQVHGTATLWADRPGRHDIEADVLLARQKVSAAVVTADCVPVLIASTSGIAAAVHAGWRGTIGGASGVGLRALLDAGAQLDDIWVAIGPAIRPCCYEVSDELGERFQDRFGPTVLVRNGRHTMLDLQRANVITLGALGLPPSRIEVLGHCTKCETTAEGLPRFHSYRRDGPSAGRQISYVSATAGASVLTR